MPSLPALIAAAALLSATPTLASTDAQRAAAQRHIDQAVEAYKAGDVETALERFRAADAHATDRAGVRYNIGRCLEELDRPLDARAAYRSMLGVDELSAAMRDRARAKIDEIESTRLARLTVTCDRPAQVRIGDQPARPCPVEGRLVEPGQQAIVAIAEDGAEARESVELKAGETSTLRLDLPAPQAPPIVDASLDPLGRVVEDDVTVGGGSTTGPVVLSIVGGVALAAGGLALWQADAAFARAEGAHSDYETAIEPDEVANLRSTTQQGLDDGELYANLGYGLLVGGGAALLGGLIWYATIDGPGEPTVWLQPGPSGVAITGAW